MKVLLGSDTYLPDVNGAATFTRSLARGLAARGHEVHVVAAAEGFRSARARRDGLVEHRVRSLPVPTVPHVRYAPLPGMLRIAACVLDDVAPDVVHVQGHFSIGRSLLRASGWVGVPTVATNHFLPDNLTHHLRLPPRGEALAAELAWRDFARVFALADVVTAPTSVAAALTGERAGRGVLAISCGTDLTRFSPSVSGQAFRERHGLGRRLTITHVGRLDPEKNVDQLLGALPLVRREVDAQLLVVGAGCERQRLGRLAEHLGVTEHVTFAGLVPEDDLPRAYAASDVCVNAGVAELQSLVTLEAMASGKPVVGADARALPLLVREGENGHLFTPGDVPGLAQVLVRLLREGGVRGAMGARSLELAAAHGHEATLDAFEAVYRGLVGTGRGRAEAMASPEPATA